MRSAGFAKAKFQDTELQGVDLSQAKDLTREQLEGACGGQKNQASRRIRNDQGLWHKKLKVKPPLARNEAIPFSFFLRECAYHLLIQSTRILSFVSH